MISLELFTKIIQDIQKQEIKDEQLTNLLVCPDCTGWINSAEDLICDLIKLLSHELGDKYDYIEWWLYDLKPEDNNKFIYDNIVSPCGKFGKVEKSIRYDLNSIEDLYYYVTGQLDKVKQEEYNEENISCDECILREADSITIDLLKKIWKNK